eukprot:jgi/Chrpa1/5555/Chrysochromulina_OHIO_Genome00013487-RA
MDSLPEAHGDRFVVPDAITLEQLEDTKRGVCALLPYGVKYENWYPPIVLSYASGRRTNRKGIADDCDGSGPGVMYAKGLMEFLHERGLQCFSGLQVPPGVDWETFMLRLTGENGKREKPKVLIIILTAGLYQSKPCLKEIDTAIKHEVELLPVRFEDKLPGKIDQWTNLKGQEWEMRKFRVQEKLNALNNIPNPGTVLNRANSLQDIVAAIEKHLPAPASPATSTPTPQPPLPKPPGGPSEGPRFPVGSRVYVDQGHGQESLSYVATHNAAKSAYDQGHRAETREAIRAEMREAIRAEMREAIRAEMREAIREETAAKSLAEMGEDSAKRWEKTYRAEMAARKTAKVEAEAEEIEEAESAAMNAGEAVQMAKENLKKAEDRFRKAEEERKRREEAAKRRREEEERRKTEEERRRREEEEKSLQAERAAQEAAEKMATKKAAEAEAEAIKQAELAARNSGEGAAAVQKAKEKAAQQAKKDAAEEAVKFRKEASTVIEDAKAKKKAEAEEAAKTLSDVESMINALENDADLEQAV